MASDRSHDWLASDEACALMARAGANAIDDSAPALRGSVGAVAAMASTTAYRDPAALVGKALGLPRDAVRVRADPGTLQQQVVHWAVERLATHPSEAVLVVGGEARYRDLQARLAGAQAGWSEQPESAAPDVTWELDPGIVSAAERAVQMFDAGHHYALMESALARQRGGGIDAHRDAVANLWATFSEVASNNADAWNRERVSAEHIRDAGPGNRMVAWPYTKLLNTQWNVNQAAALVFCTVETAEAAGVPEDQWIYLRGSAISNAVQPLTLRPNITRAPWVAFTSEAALRQAEVSIDDIELLELYSCFPSAVQIQAAEMGIDLGGRAPTITGGMTFAGGPFNSWVLHGIVAMAHRLREASGEQHGIVTSISGMITKHGTGVWSNRPGPVAPTVDVTNEVGAALSSAGPALAAPDGTTGPAEVQAATVAWDRNGPVRALAIAEHADGRVLTQSSDPAVMEAVMADHDAVDQVVLTADGFTVQTG